VEKVETKEQQDQEEQPPKHSPHRKKNGELGMVVHPCNTSIWEDKTGGSQFQGQFELNSEFKVSLDYTTRLS
jgi:hypothetical protein